MKKVAIALLTIASVCPHVGAGASGVPNQPRTPVDDTAAAPDGGEGRAEESKSSGPAQISRLTDDDYVAVASRLGVEVAAIKAVVEIEAGVSHKGFSAPGLPLINFDLSMFRRSARRKGINLSKYQKTHAVVFSRPNARAYGSQQAGQHARLKAARTIDNVAAIEGTFWGMFQIGGFNWEKCGAKDIDEFVELMSRSERDQLELFAAFLISTGLDRHLKNKNWAAFARGYNGPSYASRGYHTRMASAYAKYMSRGERQNDRMIE